MMQCAHDELICTFEKSDGILFLLIKDVVVLIYSKAKNYLK